ncbi:MAG TPA: hypothetical protein VGS19_17175 [Streptosporangiaceae bacterium]|nr:hypothetical protein [Streptosporangiaceae bacterium]
MDCGADLARPKGRGARWAAILTAACLVAACSGNGLRHSVPSSQRLGRRIPPAFFFAGGGEPVVFIGPAGGGRRPAISVPPIPPASSSLTIAMPLEAYEAVWTQQQETLAQASSELVQSCMAERGFADSGSSAGPTAGLATLQAVETSGIGVTSLAQAQTFGFATPKGAGAAASGPQIIGFVGQGLFAEALKAGKAYTEALFGFGPGGLGPGGHAGCYQQASQQVYGPLTGSPDPDPVPQIAQQALGFTRTDPRVRTADQVWSRCMARRYYRYATPGQAEDRGWPSPPTKAEITTAVADVTCKTQANLPNTWLTVEAAYQRALIGQNLAALSELQTNFAPLLRRAETALAAPGPRSDDRGCLYCTRQQNSPRSWR